MLTDWTGSPAWTAAGWTMLHFLWLGTVLGVSGRFVGRALLRRAPPPFRYALSLISLATLVATAAILFGDQLRRATSAAADRTEVQAGLRDSTAPDPAPGRRPAGLAPSPEASAARRTHGLDPDGAGSYDWATFSDALAAQAPWVWLAGTPLTLLGLGLGLAGTCRLRRQGVVRTERWMRDRCEQLRRTLRLTRRVAVMVSDRVVSPVLVGVIKPVILLPPALLTGWTPAQVEMVLLHELAHVRRWDALVNLGQRLIEALLFFHPMVWVVSRWVRAEREECCDAVVIRHSGNARGYAEALALLAATTADLTPLPVLAVARHPVVHRIRRILQLDDRWLPVPGELVAGAAALLAAVLLLSSLAAVTLNALQPGKATEDRSPEPDRLPATLDERERAGAPAGQRVLRFPEDRSLGEVYVRNPESGDAPAYRMDQWRWASWVHLGAAKGAVTVPAGQDVRLAVDGVSALRDLSPLAALGADDLDELTISYWGPPQLLADGAILAHLSHLTGLEALTLERIPVTHPQLALLTGLRTLRHLSIRCSLPQPGLPSTLQLDEACLAQLAGLSTLESLCLAGADLSDPGVARLVRLSRLSELELWSPQLNGSGLAALQELPSLRYLRLGGPGLTESCLPTLAGLRALRRLDLRDLEITDTGLAHLASLTQLETLSVSSAGITGQGIALLEPLRALRELEVNQLGQPVPLGDDVAGSLRALRSLERLSLFNCGFTDAGLAQFAGLTHLKSLLLPTDEHVRHVTGEVYYTDAGLEAISRLAGLETLAIGSPAITDQGLTFLKKLGKLKELHLSAPQVSNAGVGALASLGALESLTLRTPGVTLSGLNQLKALGHLRWLDATLGPQDNQGLDLSQLTQLEELRITLRQVREGDALRADGLRDEDMTGLAGLTQLRWLRGIRGISDVGMKALANLTAMEGLDIGGPGVTDAGLAHLIGMSRLRHLTLTGRFTDAGLRHLEGLPSLRFLGLEPAGQMSPASRQRLLEQRPELQVLDGAGFGGGG